MTDPRNGQRLCGTHYVQPNTTQPQKEWILPFAMTWMELGNYLKGKKRTKRSQAQEDEKNVDFINVEQLPEGTRRMSVGRERRSWIDGS